MPEVWNSIRGQVFEAFHWYILLIQYSRSENLWNVLKAGFLTSGWLLIIGLACSHRDVMQVSMCMAGIHSRSEDYDVVMYDLVSGTGRTEKPFYSYCMEH